MNTEPGMTKDERQVLLQLVKAVMVLSERLGQNDVTAMFCTNIIRHIASVTEQAKKDKQTG